MARIEVDRRTFLSVSAALGANRVLSASSRIKAVALDAFTVFDPRPVAARAEEVFPGKGAELTNAWRTRQFEYTWLRTLTGAYQDFWRVTEDALVFAAIQLKLDLTPDRRDQLMQCFLRLQAWPDAPAALRGLKSSGIRMAFLSNFTEAMLDAAVRNCGLQGIFEPHLSTDKVRVYKPHPRAYRMAVDAFHLPPREIAFAAYAGWDVAGAKAFGLPTFWLNRMNLPAEKLGAEPDATGAGLPDLTNFVWKGATA